MGTQTDNAVIRISKLQICRSFRKNFLILFHWYCTIWTTLQFQDVCAVSHSKLNNTLFSYSWITVYHNIDRCECCDCSLSVLYYSQYWCAADGAPAAENVHYYTIPFAYYYVSYGIVASRYRLFYFVDFHLLLYDLRQYLSSAIVAKTILLYFIINNNIINM